MRKTIFSVVLILIWACFITIGWGAPEIYGLPKDRVPLDERIKIIDMPYFTLALPDLSPFLSGPAVGVAGEDISLKVTMKNLGTVSAPGTSSSGPGGGYHVDLILSSDTVIPMAPGVWPGYAGYTEHDFIEDMLLMGGRISVTNTLAGRSLETATLNVPIPRNTAPGNYFVGAVIDPFANVAESNEGNNIHMYHITIIAAEPSPVTPPGGIGVWVMPYAVGGTPINVIKPTGLVDYFDGLSSLSMVNAPWGGRLGFRLGNANVIPIPQVKYYRWLYRKDTETTWHEFTEPVGVHYVRDDAGTISFPVYNLGPKSIAGKSLYEFRPHNPPNELPIVTYWPTTQWFGDIYSGFLKTQPLAEGKYWIKLEIYNNAGVQTMPGPTHTFIVPDGTSSGGTILTRTALPSEISAGGFIFPLHIDNNPCTAYIDGPSIGGSVASDTCGFLLYNSTSDNVRIAYTASHPNGYAMHRFRTVRGIQNAFTPVVAEVSAVSAPPFTGNGAGYFWNNFTVSSLLSPACPEKAAFSENLHVYAKATRGWHQRINSYDAHFVRAFALAPVTLY